LPVMPMHVIMTQFYKSVKQNPLNIRGVPMYIGACKLYLTADWVTSLKEKRSVVKGIVERTKHRFNVSIAEIEDMDEHKRIVVGFACVSNGGRHAEDMVRSVAAFIENNTDARVDGTETEIEIF